MAETAARIDKWLWQARMTKTRMLAQKMVKNGQVRVNRIRTTSPARQVRIGDVLTLTLPGAVRILRILAIPERRGPYREAQLLYEDLSPPLPARPAGHGGTRAEGGARPDRRERRARAALRGKIS